MTKAEYDKQYYLKNKKKILEGKKKHYSENRDTLVDKKREYSKSLIGKYNAQRMHSKERGIEFNLSFDEWVWFWNGNIDKRGTYADQLCMCRKDDKGAYEIGNIYLDTNSNNSKLMHKLREVSQ